jgi:hypothetical protein
MPAILANSIQKLLREIERLKKTLESSGDEGQIKLKNINADDVLNTIPRTQEGNFDAQAWEGMGESGQRERHSKLICVLEALKAAAGPANGSSGYGAALTSTVIFLPGAATLFTLVLILYIHYPPGEPSTYQHLPIWGTLVAFAVWLLASLMCSKLANAKHAIPSSYGDLLPRLDELGAGLKGSSPEEDSPKKTSKNNAYCEAVKEHDGIRKDLEEKGLTWVLATGYSKVWSRLYRAEEAMIEVAPQKKILEGAYYDEARLDGSDIPNRDDLLAKLRKAVVSIDPNADRYLKSTGPVAAPPALAIATTALPGGTVAAEYCAPLLATGGVPPYKWVATGGAIPDGLVLLNAAGVLRGTPTNDGHGNFTLQVTDNAGVTVEKHFDLLISPQTTVPPLAFSTTSPLPPGTVDSEYTERLFATGGKPPCKWRTIPDKVLEGMGLNLSNEGLLSGRPLKENASFKFLVEVADSTPDPKPIQREFELLIKPSAAAVAAPVCFTESEQLARAALRHVRNAINEYRNTRWNGLIVARNRLVATFTLTAMIIFALLAIAIMSGAEKSMIIAATVFYLVGATVGLLDRLRSASQAESAIPDYGLSAARLITVPLFSGLGALGGLLLVAYLPFSTQYFGPNPQLNTPAAVQATEQTAPAQPPGQKPSTPAKPGAPSKDAAQKIEPKTVAPAKADDPKKPGPPEKAAAEKAAGAKTVVPDKPSPPEGAGDKTAGGKTGESGTGTGQKKTDDQAAMQKQPPKLQDIFDINKNLIGLFVAMVFGLTPGLLFDRLQQQTEKYKADLKNTQPTGAAQKS